MHKNYIIPLVSFVLLICSLTDAAIYRRMLADGSVEYYNRNERKWNAIPQKINFSTEYDSLINRISSNHSVDPYLIKCIIKVESNFKSRAVSEAGAMGLMQLMQYTAEYYKISDPLDPEQNLQAGIAHFKSLLKHFANDIPLALAAYHAGLGRVNKNRSIPPIKATIDYVNKIMYLYRGGNDYSRQVKKLYQKIEKDGTLLIYSKS